MFFNRIYQYLIHVHSIKVKFKSKEEEGIKQLML